MEGGVWKSPLLLLSSNMLLIFYGHQFAAPVPDLETHAIDHSDSCDHTPAKIQPIHPIPILSSLFDAMLNI